jgi:hypothetical protein
MEKFQEVFDTVKSGVKQKSSSRKDEVTIMKALMNDIDYSTKIYGTLNGIDIHYPSKDLRKVVTNAISEITKIPKREAAELVNNYEFTKSDAQAMVNLSKEFTYSYLQTGRKLPIGGRLNSNVELIWKNIAAREANLPNGKKKSVIIPEHGGIKAINKTPEWIIADESGKIIGITYAE